MSELKKIKLTYVGQRISSKGKLCYGWMEDDKVWCHAKQLIWAKIGETFTFTQTEAGGYYIRGEHAPVLVLGEPTTDDKARASRWEVEQVAARMEVQERKTEAKMKARKSELEQAIEPLRRFLDACPSHVERGAVISFITRELWRK